MTAPPPDGSRDRRIEDLSNLHIIHPAARALLPVAIRWGVSANIVSIAGLILGLAATACFTLLPGWAGALLGLLFAGTWLIADGLDGMIARTTGTSSAAGRVLDGVCDHGVFLLLYGGMAASIGTSLAWGTAIVAGVAHGVQSALYEGERARFHRRLRREPPPPRSARVPVYDTMALAADRAGEPLDALILARGGESVARAYGDAAVPPMRVMALLSANVRVLGIFAACALARPFLYWWFELGPLTLVAAATMLWQRHVEADLVERCGGGDAALGRRA